MKLRKHISIFTLSSVFVSTTSILSSCGCSSTQVYKVIPFGLLDIRESVLYGFIEGANISAYNTLVIPEGTKCIWDYAFANTFTYNNNSNIKYLKIANSLRRIGYGSFMNDTSLEVISFDDCDINFSYYCDIQPVINYSNDSNPHYGSFENVRPIGDALIIKNQTDVSYNTLKRKLIDGGIPEPWFEPDSTGKIKYIDESKQKRAINLCSQYNFKLTNNVYQLEVIPTITSRSGNTTIEIKTDVDNLKVVVGVEIQNANQGDFVNFDLMFVAWKNGKVAWRQPITGFNIFRQDQEGDTTLNITDDGVCNGFKTGTPESEILKEFRNNELVIPARVKSIGKSAFNNDTVSTKIPSNIFTVRFAGDKCTTIQQGAFYDCTNITNFELPNSILEIKQNVFAGNIFTQFTLPTNLRSIGYGAFYQCKELTSITFPSSLSSVGYGAFANCDSLTTLDFSNYKSIPTWEYDTEVFYGVGVSEESKGTIKIAQGQDLEQWKTFLTSINLDLDCWNIVQNGGR